MAKAVKAVSNVVTAVIKPFTKVFGLLMPKMPSVPGSEMSGAELRQVIRSAKEPARYVFGRAGTGALLAWAQEEAGEQTEGERLYLVYVLTEGAIDGMEEIYVNQEPIATAGDRIRYEVISDATAVNDYMLEHSPDWRDTQIGRGLTWVSVTLKYDPEFFASGIPDLLFVYRARNDIYDPRTETTGYTDNAALVILWYLRHRLRVPDDEILWETFIAAANLCDEWVTNPDGSTERRYVVSGGFKADERKDRVLADLMAACAGSLLRIGGKFGLQVGAYYGPAEIEIDEDMITGAITGQTEVSRADAVNTMRGTFVSPDARWVETDFPAVSVPEWIEEDGEQIDGSLTLRFVPSPYQAQRLANIALRKKRAGGRLQLPLNYRGYACRPGRVIRVNLPTLNILGEFLVDEWEMSPDNGCRVTLSQTSAEIYDDAVGEPFDPGSFIRLPTGGIGSPTGLRWVVDTVGEVVQGALLWNPVEAAIHYNVVVKSGGVAVQSAQVPAGVERCELGGLPAGDYVIEVRARGQLRLSGPATINITINVPAAPDRVIVTRGNRELTLVPQLPAGESLAGGYYRYYYTQSEGTSQPQAEYLGDGLTFTHTGLAPATTYYYYVQSVNAYGASPFLRVSVETTNDFSEEWEAIEQEIYRPGGLVDQFENDINGLRDTITSVGESVEDAQSAADAALAEAQAALDAAMGADGTAEEAREDAAQALADAQAALAAAEQAGVGVDEARAVADAARAVADAASGEAEQARTDAQSAITRAQTALDNLDFEVLAQSVRNAAMSARIANTSATQSVEHIVRVGAEAALSQRIETLTASLGEAESSLSERLTTLATTTQALADTLLQLRTELDDSTAEFEQQITVLSDETQALGTSIAGLRTEYESALATVNDTLTTLSNDTQALASAQQQLRGEFDDNVAAVDSSLTALADGQQALVTDVESYKTEANGRLSSAEQSITVLSDGQQALGERTETLEGSVEDNAASIRETQQTIVLDNLAQAIRNAAMSASTQLAHATASTEHIVRVDAERALSQLIIDLEAVFEGSEASVEQRLTALATAQQALSETAALLRTDLDNASTEFSQQISALSTQTAAIGTALDQLSSSYNDSTADFEQRITTLADETQGLVNSTSQLSADIDGVSARLTTEEQTRASETGALSAAQQQLRTDYEGNKTAVNNSITALSNSQQSLAQDVSQLETDYEGNKSSVRNELNTLSNDTQSLAASQQQLRTEFDDNVASVDSSLTALSNEQQSIISDATAYRTANDSRVASAEQSITLLSDEQQALVAEVERATAELGAGVASVTRRVDAYVAGETLAPNGLFVTGDFTDWAPDWDGISIVQRNDSAGDSAVRNMPAMYAARFPSTGWDNNRRLRSAPQAVSAGDEYTISVDYATGGSSRSVPLTVWIGYRIAGGNWDYTLLGGVTATSTGWNKTPFYSVTIPTDVTEARISLSRQTDGNGTLYVTNIQASRIDVAMAQRIEEVSAESTSGLSDVNQTLRAFSDAQQSLANDVSSLSAEYNDNKADVEQDLIALSNAQQATAGELSTYKTQANGRLASAESSIIALSDEQGAQAGRLDQFEINVDGQFASVQQDLSAVYDPATGAVARAVTTVQTPNGKAMIGMQVDGDTAEIVAIANSFAVLNPVNGQLVTAFVIADGRVILPEAFINALTITKLRSSSGSLVFQDDRLQAAFIAVEQLNVEWAQIQNVRVTNAQLENGAISKAKIGEGQVDTLQVAGEAINAEEMVSTTGGTVVTGDNSWSVVQQTTIRSNNTGSPVRITAMAYYDISWAVGMNPPHQRLIARLVDATDGVTLGPEVAFDESPDNLVHRAAGVIVLQWRLPSNWSNKVIHLEVRNQSFRTTRANYTIRNRSISHNTVKR